MLGVGKGWTWHEDLILKDLMDRKYISVMVNIKMF